MAHRSNPYASPYADPYDTQWGNPYADPSRAPTLSPAAAEALDRAAQERNLSSGRVYTAYAPGSGPTSSSAVRRNFEATEHRGSSNAASGGYAHAASSYPSGHNLSSHNPSSQAVQSVPQPTYTPPPVSQPRPAPSTKDSSSVGGGITIVGNLRKIGSHTVQVEHSSTLPPTINVNNLPQYIPPPPPAYTGGAWAAK